MDGLFSPVPSPSNSANKAGGSESISYDYYFAGEVFVIALILLSFFVGSLVKHSRFYVYMQEAAATVVFSTLVALFFRLIEPLLNYDVESKMQMNTSFFYLVLLPPILFEAGFVIKRKQFFRNFGTIVNLAFFGTIASAFIMAILVYYGSQLTNYPISLIEAFTFGAVMSATDTVSVLAVLQECPIQPFLFITVFGESALNDAVALIIYKTVTSFAGMATLTPDMYVVAVFKAIGVFIGSTLLGVVIGMLLALVLKYTHFQEHPESEVAYVFFFAYSSYILAESIHLSGMVTILFSGISMAHYAANNLSENGYKLSKDFVRVFSHVSETVIFIFLGLSLVAFSGKKPQYHYGFCIVAVFAVLMSRLHVFLICAFSNYFRPEGQKYTIRHQIFLFYAGLRGVLCFVLSLQLYDMPAYSSQFQQIMLGTTLAVVFVTLICFGAGTMTLLKFLRINVDQKDDANSPTAALDANEKVPLQFLLRKWKNFDKQVIIPFLKRKQDPNGEYIHFHGEGLMDPEEDEESSRRQSVMVENENEGDIKLEPIRNDANIENKTKEEIEEFSSQ